MTPAVEEQGLNPWTVREVLRRYLPFFLLKCSRFVLISAYSSDSVIHIFLFNILFHYSLSQEIDYSSLYI